MNATKLILYGAYLSHPSRAVMMTAKQLGLSYQLKIVDVLRKQEQKQEWFLKMNPNHTIPTLDDNGFYLWESRAIMAYLVQQYGQNDHLYPKEPKQRAIVDSVMYFDMGFLDRNVHDYYFPPLFKGMPVNHKKGQTLHEKLSVVENMLEKRNYTACDHLTIADLCVIQSVANVDVYGHDLSVYPNIVKWYQKLQNELPYYDECMKEGLETFKKLIQRAKVKNNLNSAQ